MAQVAPKFWNLGAIGPQLGAIWSPVQHVLSSIWGDLLGLNKCDVTDQTNFEQK